jgi:putative membrane protein
MAMFKKAFTMSAALALGVAMTAAVPMDQAQAQRRAPGRAADMTYVANAGSSDQYEIQSSQLALERSQSNEVREFAQMMIADHNRTTQEVTAAAQRDGLSPPPPMLMPRHRTMLRQLGAARGRSFDTLYISQQRTAHQEALTLHRTRARTRPDSALSQAAATAVPIVQTHIDHLRHLGMGGTGHRM